MVDFLLLVQNNFVVFLNFILGVLKKSKKAIMQQLKIANFIEVPYIYIY